VSIVRGMRGVGKPYQAFTSSHVLW
jgi:hypothetical protein